MRKKSIIVVAVLVLIDQLSKYLISTSMQLYEKKEIISDFFSILYIRNDGAAFSILEGKTFIFYIGTIIGLILVYYFYKESKSKLSYFSTSLLLAGILGNFIDRIRFQEVIDFLSFKIFGYDFAIFNFADIYVCVGVGLLILDQIIVERRKRDAKKNNK